MQHTSVLHLLILHVLTWLKWISLAHWLNLMQLLSWLLNRKSLSVVLWLLSLVQRELILLRLRLVTTVHHVLRVITNLVADTLLHWLLALNLLILWLLHDRMHLVVHLLMSLLWLDDHWLLAHIKDVLALMHARVELNGLLEWSHVLLMRLVLDVLLLLVLSVDVRVVEGLVLN